MTLCDPTSERHCFVAVVVFGVLFGLAMINIFVCFFFFGAVVKIVSIISLSFLAVGSRMVRTNQ